MSYLYRSGNGRNNIAYTNTANSSTKYLRRLGSGRTNINWYTIPAGSTYNILQRNGTGRNNILWANLKIASPGEPATTSDIPGNDRTTYDPGYIIEYVFRFRKEGAMANDRVRGQLEGTETTGSNYLGMNPRYSDVYVYGHGSSAYIDQLLKFSSPYVVSSSETVQGVFANIIAKGKKLTLYKDSNHWITLKIGSVARYPMYGVLFNILDYRISFASALDFNHWVDSVDANKGYLIKAVWSTVW